MGTILVAQDHQNAGGAAQAANRWVNLLGRGGVAIRQITGDEKPFKGTLLTGKPARGWERFIECFRDRALHRKLEVNQKLKSILSKEKSELVWFHNIAGGRKWGWSDEMIALSRQHAPVVWTLHDMWALGDGKECYFDETSVRNGITVSRARKLCMGVGVCPVVLTAPSKWLADLTTDITGQKCWHLPNPIDFQIYSPGDQVAARRRFGLPEEGVVILAGADSLQDERKGFDLLLEAWGQGRKNTTLALFGRNGQEREGIVNLGSIGADEAMADAYRAADLYVHPARMENAPCQIQESLACGTPVLAFPVGGIPEMIQSGENGFLAGEVTANSLNECLQRTLVDVHELHLMRKKCRRFAEGEWDQEKLMTSFKRILATVNTEES